MDKDNVPLEDIQLTFALIFLSACYQNNNNLFAGLHPIPEYLQTNIVNNFFNLKYAYDL
jgi:hypothetical protein